MDKRPGEELLARAKTARIAELEKELQDLEELQAQEFKRREQEFEARLAQLKSKRPLQRDRHRGAMEIARSSFQTSFRGEAHTVLRDRINADRKLLNTDCTVKYLTALGALVQSSGMGKSRAVLELAEHGIFLCYCSLAKKDSSAFPPRTKPLADTLENSDSDVVFVYYFKVWLIALARFLRAEVTEWNNEEAVKQAAVKWKNLQLQDGFPLHTEISVELATLAAKMRQEQDYSANPEEQDTRNIGLVSAELAVVERLLSALDGVRLVFVFDEAGSLISSGSGTAFFVARRALQVFLKRKMVFALMLDTEARLWNVLPPRQLDDLSKRAPLQGSLLLPPIYYVSSFKNHIPELATPGFPQAEEWMRYGRPLWAAAQELEHDTGERVALRSAAQLLNLALAKLVVVSAGVFQGHQVNISEGKMTVTQGLSLLAAATGLEICPKSIIAATMAASHMNVINYVSEDRRTVFVTQPYEPILAEAAGSMLADKKVLAAALRHMLSSCMSGYVTGGGRGEFVVKLLLVAAVWACKKDLGKKYALDGIPMGTYLEKLLCGREGVGNEDLEQLRLLKERVQGCIIRFNSFVILTHPPTKEDLKRALVAGSAIVYMADNNLPGADIIVPFGKADGEGEAGAMVVSVKNWKRSYWLQQESTRKPESKYTRGGVEGIDLVTVLMSMRESSVSIPTAWRMWFGQNSQLTIYGLKNNYGFLDKDVRELLQLLLVTVPDPMAHAKTDEEVMWIKELQNNVLEQDD